MHTILKCKVILCARTLGSSLFILEHFLDPFDWLLLFVEVSFNLFFFLQYLDPQYSLISFPTIRQWICAFDFTHTMRNAHFMGELLLYWPSKKKFLPFRQSMPMGERFRGFKGTWFLFSCILAFCVAWLF